MAKMIEYTVRFAPATKTDGGHSFTLTDILRAKKQTFQASSLAEIDSAVRALAAEFGQSCTAMVSLPNGARKMPGFDKAVKALEFIEYKPPAQVAA